MIMAGYRYDLGLELDLVEKQGFLAFSRWLRMLASRRWESGLTAARRLLRLQALINPRRDFHVQYCLRPFPLPCIVHRGGMVPFRFTNRLPAGIAGWPIDHPEDTCAGWSPYLRR